MFKKIGLTMGVVCIGCVLYGMQFFFGVSNTKATAMPLANYYLNELQNSAEFINIMSQFDVLILTPSQVKAHPQIIKSIRAKNPQIQILGYVGSQSYNTQYWPKDVIFKHLKPKESWWLRDVNGNIISHWPGLLHTNMSEQWVNDLLLFVEDHLLSIEGMDGIFFDMVSHNISWLNNGNIDSNSDGKKDIASTVDALWKKRTADFLLRARDVLGDERIIVANGTSDSALQPAVNGRMFETFPTPWEGDGSWKTVMNAAVAVQKKHVSPQFSIFNGNTNNTGRQLYSQVRFGLGSSLLLDNVYFSYDYGDTNHGQTWWYDEYEVDLGEPTGSARSLTGQTSFGPGVWQREFSQGIALVNSGKQSSKVALPGEYEKIRGTQDKTVNDGSIVSSVTVPAQDGLLLLRTIQKLDGIMYINGDFARFFKKSGDRVRNGFFLYDSIAPGGAQVGRIDIDGDDKLDSVVVTKNRITIRRNNGKLLARFRPYGLSFSSGIRIAFGDIDSDGKKEMIVAPGAKNFPIKLYDYAGSKIGEDWYPFGKAYADGYSVALSQESENERVVFGSSKGTISVFDPQTRKQVGSSWKAFSGNSIPYVAMGNIDSSSEEEIVVGAGKGGGATVKVFSVDGKVQSEFVAYSTIVSPGLPVQLADVDTNGVLDIVTLSSGF